MPRVPLAELQADPPKLRPVERARIDALTDEDIEQNAESDLDTPSPMTDDALDHAAFARDVRRAREATGLTQHRFAERFHISPRRLKDWERGRYAPVSVAVAYLKAILHDPKAIERPLGAVD